jgi:hypothetical protein
MHSFYARMALSFIRKMQPKKWGQVDHFCFASWSWRDTVMWPVRQHDYSTRDEFSKE